jgi:hypothetical protein
MKLFTGCWALSLGLILLAGAAHAQVVAPAETGKPSYRAASDFSGPYGDVVPPEVPPYAAAPPQTPPYAAMPPELPGPGYGPALLPPAEVYAVLRETGFRPLGVVRLRGMFYVIAVADRYGEEGRLVIDARTGQIVRFVPAFYRMGDAYGAAPVPYAAAGRQQAFGDLRDPPRPPAAIPNLASRAPVVPMPKPAPPRSVEDKKLTEKPAQPPLQSAAVQAKPADTPGAQVTPAVTEPKPPAPQIQPTRPMPNVQGLE